MDGKQILKKSKKIPTKIKIGYIISILMILIAIYLINSAQKASEGIEPVNISETGTYELGVNQYVSIDVQGLTTEIARLGDSNNIEGRFFIAISDENLFLVDLDSETIDKLKEVQEYLSSDSETVPQPVLINGITEEIPTELKKIIIEYYNSIVGEESAITESEFENLFGSVLINTRKGVVDTSFEESFIILGVFGIIIIFITHIIEMFSNKKIIDYLKKNDYEEDLINQLDNTVEEKHYKDKVIITKDYLVDISHKFTAFKFSDVKWIHVHNVRYYGTITVSSSIIVHLKDGKTNLQCVEIKGKETDEFAGILNKICEKIPADSLKGYTKENAKEFNEYRRQVRDRN